VYATSVAVAHFSQLSVMVGMPWKPGALTIALAIELASPKLALTVSATLKAKCAAVVGITVSMRSCRFATPATVTSRTDSV
jgi:hypothetical protein